MQQHLQNKKGLVQSVFDQVYNKYDLMNDFMSLGVHRFWKKSLISMMNPSLNKKLIDVACGTGVVTKQIQKKVGKSGYVIGIDTSITAIKIAKKENNKNKN